MEQAWVVEADVVDANVCTRGDQRSPGRHAAGQATERLAMNSNSPHTENNTLLAKVAAAGAQMAALAEGAVAAVLSPLKRTQAAVSTDAMGSASKRQRVSGQAATTPAAACDAGTSAVESAATTLLALKSAAATPAATAADAATIVAPVPATTAAAGSAERGGQSAAAAGVKSPARGMPAAGAASASPAAAAAHIAKSTPPTSWQPAPVPTSPSARTAAAGITAAATAAQGASKASLVQLQPGTRIRCCFSSPYTKQDGSASKSSDYRLFDASVAAVYEGGKASLTAVAVATGTRGSEDVLVQRHCSVLAGKPQKMLPVEGLRGTKAGSWCRLG